MAMYPDVTHLAPISIQHTHKTMTLNLSVTDPYVSSALVGI